MSLVCVRSGLKRWGRFCGLDVIPHLPPSEFAVLRRRSLVHAGRAFRMFLADLVEDCQLNDCNATSWFCERVTAVPKGLRKSRDGPFSSRPPITKHQLCELVRLFCPPDEFSLPAVIRWSSLRRVNSEPIPMEGRGGRLAGRLPCAKTSPEEACGVWGDPHARPLLRTLCTLQRRIARSSSFPSGVFDLPNRSGTSNC